MLPDVVHEGRPIGALVVEEGVHIRLERAAVALHDSEVVVEGHEGVARVPGHVHNLEHAMGFYRLLHFCGISYRVTHQVATKVWLTYIDFVNVPTYCASRMAEHPKSISTQSIYEPVPVVNNIREYTYIDKLK